MRKHDGGLLYPSMPIKIIPRCGSLRRTLVNIIMYKEQPQIFFCGSLSYAELKQKKAEKEKKSEKICSKKIDKLLKVWYTL